MEREREWEGKIGARKGRERGRTGVTSCVAFLCGVGVQVAFGLFGDFERSGVLEVCGHCWLFLPNMSVMIGSVWNLLRECVVRVIRSLVKRLIRSCGFELLYDDDSRCGP